MRFGEAVAAELFQLRERLGREPGILPVSDYAIDQSGLKVTNRTRESAGGFGAACRAPLNENGPALLPGQLPDRRLLVHNPTVR